MNVWTREDRAYAAACLLAYVRSRRQSPETETVENYFSLHPEMKPEQ